MKIFKIKDGYISLFDLDQFFLNKCVIEGDKIGISNKVGKNRKLKTFHVVTLNRWVCDDCGPITAVELKNSYLVIKMDNHFGSSRYYL